MYPDTNPHLNLIQAQPQPPKFNVFPGSAITPGVRLVELNEEAAKRLHSFIMEVEMEPGDEWIFALGKRLKTSFTTIPRVSHRYPRPISAHGGTGD